MTTVEPWQTWFVDLDPSVGYEQGGKRPAVVVSSEWRNKFPNETYLVVPLTTRDRKLLHHVSITSESSGLDRPSWARTEDVQCASILRFKSRKPLGRLAGSEIRHVQRWLRSMFDLGR